MTSNNRLVILVLFFAVCFQPLFAQYNWELKKQTDGITIYTSPFPGSDFKVFKSVTQVKASGIQEIVDIVTDVNNFSSLFPDILDSRILKKDADGSITHYILNKAPWPVDDRDGVFILKPAFSASKKEVLITDQCIVYDYPERPGTVRMNKGEGFWKIVELDNNLYEVTYQFHGEPGGTIPAWLANSFVVDQPFDTLKNLRILLERRK